MELTPSRRPEALAEAHARHEVRMNQARALAAGALRRLVKVLEDKASDAETSPKDVVALVAEIRAIEAVPVPELHLHQHQAEVHVETETLKWLAELGNGNGNA